MINFKALLNKISIPQIICFIFFSLFIATGWTEIIDDAYIYFRYIFNLAEGNGYTYNIGHPVEAATSFTWPFLLTILYKIGISPEISVRVLGYIIGIGIISLVWKELKDGKTTPFVGFIFLLLLSTNKNFYSSIMMGLETGLYSLLILLLYTFSKNYPNTLKQKLIFSILATLSFLTRPEFMMVSFIVTFYILVIKHKDKKRNYLIPTIILSGILLTFLFRYLYFGSMVPNSVAAKSVLRESITNIPFLIARTLGGIKYILIWSITSLPFVIPILFTYKYFIKTFLFQSFIGFTLLLTGFTAVMLNSGDWMPFSRLLTPYLPIFTILAANGTNSVLKNIELTKIKHHSILVFLIVYSFLINISNFKDISFFKLNEWPEGQCYRLLGEAISPAISDSTVIAPEGIGIIGHTLKEVQVFDFFGLIDPYIAKNGKIPVARFTMGKHHYEYTMKTKPDIFIFHSDEKTHIPFLNRFGYSSYYKTYKIGNNISSLIIGLKNKDSFLPYLNKHFTIEEIPTANLTENSEANWPLGFR